MYRIFLIFLIILVVEADNEEKMANMENSSNQQKTATSFNYRFAKMEEEDAKSIDPTERDDMELDNYLNALPDSDKAPLDWTLPVPPNSGFPVLTLLNATSFNHYYINPVCLNDLNILINLRFYTSILYEQMGFWFRLNKVALRGFSDFFLFNSGERAIAAALLQEYIDRRGGIVFPYNHRLPHRNTWSGPLEALYEALAVELRVNQFINRATDAAKAVCHDENLVIIFSALDGPEQILIIDRLIVLITTIARQYYPLGIFVVDRRLISDPAAIFF